MTSRGVSILFGTAATVATATLCTASVTMLRQASAHRDASASLSAPAEMHVRDSEIARWVRGSTVYQATSDAAPLTLVLVIDEVDSERLRSVIALTESLSERESIAITILVGNTGKRSQHSLGSQVELVSIADPDAFAVNTGIRVAPFSLVLAGSTVVAAGMGWPSTDFLEEALAQVNDRNSVLPTRFRQIPAGPENVMRSIERELRSP